MNADIYQQLACRTMPKPEGHQKWFHRPHCHIPPDELTIAQAHEQAEFDRRVCWLHAMLCLPGETGEMIDPVKRSMFYGKPLGPEEIANIREEAGDLLWYIAAPLCIALQCNLSELMAENIAKLRLRYPGEYSDEAALTRADKTAAEEAGALSREPEYADAFEQTYTDRLFTAETRHDVLTILREAVRYVISEHRRGLLP